MLLGPDFDEMGLSQGLHPCFRRRRYRRFCFSCHYHRHRHHRHRHQLSSRLMNNKSHFSSFPSSTAMNAAAAAAAAASAKAKATAGCCCYSSSSPWLCLIQ